MNAFIYLLRRINDYVHGEWVVLEQGVELPASLMTGQRSFRYDQEIDVASGSSFSARKGTEKDDFSSSRCPAYPFGNQCYAFLVDHHALCH